MKKHNIFEGPRAQAMKEYSHKSFVCIEDDYYRNGAGLFLNLINRFELKQTDKDKTEKEKWIEREDKRKPFKEEWQKEYFYNKAKNNPPDLKPKKENIA